MSNNVRILEAMPRSEVQRRQLERERTDLAYNEALTALDRALPPVQELPAIPDLYDESQFGALNENWDILASAPSGPPRGLRRWLANLVWRVVAPSFHRQVAFNSVVVDHLNRNVGHHRALRESIAKLCDALGDHLGAMGSFETRLMILLQQITPYVNAKDDEIAALAFDQGLVGALNGLANELRMRGESMHAHERRYEAKIAGLAGAHADLQASVATLHQAAAVLKREVSRITASASSPAEAASSALPRPGETRGDASIASLSAPLDSYKYVGFENRFRGSTSDIRARLSDYVPLFRGATDVLDVGCGRGEFLELLREAGISARGLDLNHEMVEVCRSRGLLVDESDAVTLLRTLPDGAIGGLLAAQVVEHLTPDYLLAFLELAYAKLRPGSTVVLETINPACWFAFFESYIRDITHVRPLHPDTLSYLLNASGFQRVSVRYRAPYPEHEKLQTVPGGDDRSDTFNANVERLNSLLFTYLDYAVVGHRL